MSRPAGDLRARFEAKVSPEPTSGCWLWTSPPHNSGGFFGYGQFNVEGRGVLAHRVSWELNRGPIPDGLKVLHKCDNPACVNPDHLFVGTHADNVADRCRKGRTRQGHVQLRAGENHGCAKLTWASVDEIRARYAAGDVTLRSLGRDFGVSHRAILFIVQGKHWPEASRPAVPQHPST